MAVCWFSDGIRRLSVVAALGLALSVAPPGGASAVERPDIVLLTVDTLRADRLSIYGYDLPTSPFLDRFLGEGVLFTDARTVEPLTGPAFASLFTSLHPHQHGGTRNGLRMRDGLASLPKVLGRRGYTTAAFVSNWTLRDELSGLGEHFELYREILTKKRWFGLAKSEATAEDVTGEALAWIRAAGGEATRPPIFVWIHYVEPHAPYRLHDEFVDRLGFEQVGTFSNNRKYDTEVAFIDQHLESALGEIFQLLEPEKTLTVFLSDHGESLGDHGYWGHGRHLYEATLQIPMGLQWPGRLGAGRVAAPASIMDIAPTLVGLLELPAPPGWQGFDWSGVLTRGVPEPTSRTTYHQAHRASVEPSEDSDQLRRKGLLEVARYSERNKEVCRPGKRRRWVFDLDQDPAEKQSRVEPTSACSEWIEEWLERVRVGLEASDELPPPELDDEDLDQLRALGYLD